VRNKVNVAATERFPQSARLRRRREFQRVFTEGRKAVGPSFVCFVRRPGDRGRRLGITVSRKVGGAVERNRVKRLIREVYRKRQDHLPDDAELVVIARPPAAGLDYHESAEALEALWRRSGVWHG
jgi:ribonuclease P protein component